MKSEMEDTYIYMCVCIYICLERLVGRWDQREWKGAFYKYYT